MFIFFHLTLDFPIPFYPYIMYISLRKVPTYVVKVETVFSYTEIINQEIMNSENLRLRTIDFYKLF